YILLCSHLYYIYSFYFFSDSIYFLPLFFFFFFTHTATTEIYTLSLHDALPIWKCTLRSGLAWIFRRPAEPQPRWRQASCLRNIRSEEHTSELQSPYDLVCRLLLEKKKKKKKKKTQYKKTKRIKIEKQKHKKLNK